MKEKIYILLAVLLAVLFTGCLGDKNIGPKPKTYFRLDIPEPTYSKFDTLDLPFVFQYPDYGNIERSEGRFENKNWFNVNFPNYGSKLYLSFMRITPEITLANLVSDSYNMTKEQDKFATGVIERAYSDSDAKVYAYVFEIKGRRVVSPYQFYITDSSTYFLRGVLSLDIKPNNDSLAPIITRVVEDLDYLISTFEWK